MWWLLCWYFVRLLLRICGFVLGIVWDRSWGRLCYSFDRLCFILEVILGLLVVLNGLRLYRDSWRLVDLILVFLWWLVDGGWFCLIGFLLLEWLGRSGCCLWLGFIDRCFCGSWCCKLFVLYRLCWRWWWWWEWCLLVLCRLCGLCWVSLFGLFWLWVNVVWCFWFWFFGRWGFYWFCGGWFRWWWW